MVTSKSEAKRKLRQYVDWTLKPSYLSRDIRVFQALGAVDFAKRLGILSKGEYDEYGAFLREKI